MNIPTTRLCAAAGVGRQTYRDGLSGFAQPLPATLARLNAALNRFRGGFGAEAGQQAPGAAYRACVVLAAFMLGADARHALASDPKKRATLSPAWMAAARVRRVGIYIASQMLGFSGADLARAAGLTRGAISEALKDLYDERDSDAELAAVLGRIEEIFE